MASHLSSDSKTKNEHILQEKIALAVQTSSNQPTDSNNAVQQLNPSSMLDNIPFVLTSQTNVDSNSYDSFLEGTKNYLMSVKKEITSGVYDYDFSNEKRIVSEGTKYAK